MSSKQLFLLAWGLTAVALTPGASFAATFNLEFNTAGGGIKDKDGQGTGFPLRLSGTGGSLATNDANLDLNTATGKLTIRTGNGVGENQDFHGQSGLGTLEALGMNLSSLGYTGSQDFSISATFAPLPATTGFDQVGLFVGQSSANLTTVGTITFSAQEYFSVHYTNGVMNNGRFFGFGFNGSDGMNLTIQRSQGNWRYFIDGLEWQPNTNGDGTGTPVDPIGTNGSPNLSGLPDLTVGVFALNTANGTSETITVDSFRAIVDFTCHLEFCCPGPNCGMAAFEAISAHMFEEVFPGTDGDITLDGLVDYADFRLWKNSQGALADLAAVPEPASGLLLFWGLLSIARRPKLYPPCQSHCMSLVKRLANAADELIRAHTDVAGDLAQ